MTDAQLELEFLFRLLIAAALAAVLGWEREAKGKAAGLRTHILVGVGSALFVLIGEAMVQRYQGGGNSVVQVDMTRVLSAVAQGISFLGAGMVFVSRENTVHGLTTAASVLATAAVGIAAGLELYWLAGGTTLLILLVLSGLGLLEPRKEPNTGP
jgi:putative Mg2+ transporter-C (MgtC) family protein